MTASSHSRDKVKREVTILALFIIISLTFEKVVARMKKDYIEKAMIVLVEYLILIERGSRWLQASLSFNEYLNFSLELPKGIGRTLYLL